MKKALFTFLTISVFGCVSTQYEKSIAVTKDASGKITSVTETERVVQPNQTGWPVKFEHLKAVQPN
jgi:hypothetical protein